MIKLNGEELKRYERNRTVTVAPRHGNKLYEVRAMQNGATEPISLDFQEEGGEIIADIPDVLLERFGTITVEVVSIDKHGSVDSEKRVFAVKNNGKSENEEPTAWKPVKIPTKLSDLENDLWYSKTEQKLTITKDDFIYDADKGICYYRGTPGLEWFTALDKIGFSIVCSWEDDGETYSEVYKHHLPITNADAEYDDTEICFGGYVDEENRHYPFYGCDNCGVQVCTGFSALGTDAPEPEDAFYVIVFDWLNDNGDGVGFDSIILYYRDEKKIPIEYCDTSEIEEEINALTEEVWHL